MKANLVTIPQARALRNIGFNDEVSTYCWMSNNTSRGIHTSTPNDWNKTRNNSPWTIKIQHGVFLSIPTVDEAIDFLRRKYNIIIANKTIPFVNPKTNKIEYAFTIKQCNLSLGWNGRIIIGYSKWSNNIYATKRDAIKIALNYVKKEIRNRNNRKKKSH